MVPGLMFAVANDGDDGFREPTAPVLGRGKDLIGCEAEAMEDRLATRR